MTLVKSNISILPIYFMSLFVVPCKVNLRLEKIQRDFLLGEGISKENLILLDGQLSNWARMKEVWGLKGYLC